MLDLGEWGKGICQIRNTAAEAAEGWWVKGRVEVGFILMQCTTQGINHKNHKNNPVLHKMDRHSRQGFQQTGILVPPFGTTLASHYPKNPNNQYYHTTTDHSLLTTRRLDYYTSTHSTDSRHLLAIQPRILDIHSILALLARPAVELLPSRTSHRNPSTPREKPASCSSFGRASVLTTLSIHECARGTIGCLLGAPVCPFTSRFPVNNREPELIHLARRSSTLLFRHSPSPHEKHPAYMV